MLKFPYPGTYFCVGIRKKECFPNKLSAETVTNNVEWYQGQILCTMNNNKIVGLQVSTIFWAVACSLPLSCWANSSTTAEATCSSEISVDSKATIRQSYSLWGIIASSFIKNREGNSVPEI